MELVVIISPSCCLELATPLNQLEGRGGRAEECWVQVGMCFPGAAGQTENHNTEQYQGRAALPGPGTLGSVLGSWGGASAPGQGEP